MAHKFIFSLVFSFFISTFLFTSTYELHGVKIEDPFAYLEQMQSEKTLTWLKQQDDLAHDYFSQLKNREEIKKNLQKHAFYHRFGIPKEASDYFVYTLQRKDQDKRALYFEDLEGNKYVICDPNTFDSRENVSLTSYEISPDGKTICYALSSSGLDFKTWYFYDLENKKALNSTISNIKFCTPSFDERSEGVYYTKWERSNLEGIDKCLGIYYHAFDQKPSVSDVLIFDAQKKPGHSFQAGPTIAQGKYLLIYQMDNNYTDKNGFLFLDLKTFLFQEILPSKLADFEVIDEKDGSLLIRTSYNAPKKQIIAFNIDNPNLNEAVVVIKESNHELTSTISSKDFLICHYIDNCKSKIVFFDYLGNKSHEMAIQEPCFLALTSQSSNLNTYNENVFYFAKSDFTTPYSIYSYSIEDRNLELFFSPIKKNQAYITTQIFFKSKDGTQVPMFITRHKDAPLDGKQPTLMWGYGGFGVPILPYFFQEVPTWLEMGGTFVTVNLRGGSEYGECWHNQGKLHKKQNVFDDFISAAEYLIENKYTSSKKLAIIGGSNGGLLVGACLTQRPDLFAAAIPQVGVLDMLKFHKYTSGKAWISDYGNPDNFQDFQTLYAYSPYHNIKPATRYPATLIMTADHDDRVVPMHSYKFTAKLQSAQLSDKKIILKLARKEGHGAGGGSLSKKIESDADVLSFLQDQLDMN